MLSPNVDWVRYVSNRLRSRNNPVGENGVVDEHAKLVWRFAVRFDNWMFDRCCQECKGHGRYVAVANHFAKHVFDEHGNVYHMVDEFFPKWGCNLNRLFICLFCILVLTFCATSIRLFVRIGAMSFPCDGLILFKKRLEDWSSRTLIAAIARYPVLTNRWRWPDTKR